MRNILFILSIILLAFCLSGCIKNDGYDEKVRALEAIYPPKFIEEAKLQFGENTKVEEIKAATYKSTAPPFIELGVINGLTGVITADGKTFDAFYSASTNEIYSRIYFGEIENSIKDYFAYLNLNIRNVELKAVEIVWSDKPYVNVLPVRIKCYEDLLKDMRQVYITIYVADNNLNSISKDDFVRIRDYWREYENDFFYNTVGELVPYGNVAARDKDTRGNISFIRAPGTGQKVGDVDSVYINYNEKEEDIDFTVTFLSETEAVE